jgi:uncharacterized membrane protein
MVRPAEVWEDWAFYGETEESAGMNVAPLERWASAVAGAALARYGLAPERRRSAAGLALAFAGGALLKRGVTGHCDVYGALGVSSGKGRARRAAVAPAEGITVDESVTIQKPAEELYRFWRRLENLPRFMEHLREVREIGDGRSRWVARAPLRRTVAWDAEIVNEIENRLIGWHSVGEADGTSSGSVSFEPAPGGRGTRVRVRLQYDPPGGRLAAALAKLFGEEPSQQIREDLRRLKRIVETGEVPTIQGQPRGA